MKKIPYILAVVALVAFCLPIQAEEAEWLVDGHSIMKYLGAGGDVVVPSEIDGTPITHVSRGLSATHGNGDITSIRFSEGIAVIGNFVCEELERLTSLTLPDSLQVIESSCLRSNPNLTEITIPPAVCLIGYDAMNDNSSLRTIRFTGPCPVIIQRILRKVPEDAVIYVPDDEVEAYTAALRNAGVNLAIQTSGQNAIRPVLADETANIIFDAATGTVTDYKGKAVRLDIPAEIGGVPVKIIGKKALTRQGPLYYTLPEGVEIIEEAAFQHNVPATYVRLPSTLKLIGDQAFENTGMATDLILPEGFTSIGKGAFSMCRFENAYLPSSLESIGDDAFRSSYVEYISLEGESLSPPALGENVFADCGYLKDIDIYYRCSKQQMLEWQAYVDALGISCRVWRHQNPHAEYPESGTTSYTETPDGSFLLASYTGNLPNLRSYGSRYVGNEIKSIIGLADGALKDNQVVSFFAVSYTDEYTTIGAEAFAGSVLQHVDLFDSVTTIGAGAFRDCAQLEELTLPESVTSIGADAFAGCAGLKAVDIRCDAALLPENAFAGNPVLTQAKVSAGAIPAGAFRDTPLVSLTAGEGLTAIGAGAFQNCAQLEELTIPASVTSIGPDAFAGCAGLKKVIILCDAALLPEDVFAGCASLTEARIAAGAIPAGAFRDTPLAALAMEDGVTAIGAGAFQNCAGLKELTIPASVKSIGENAFAGTGLTSLVIPAKSETALSAVSGIADICLSGDASDEELAEWTEKLNLPWYRPMLRAGESHRPLASMPFAPTDEKLFEFDPETGALKEYIGTELDVVIPRSIGGIPVTTLKANLFQQARDYTGSEVQNDRTEWLPLRSVVIPETVRVIEDGLLQYCQQLETVICYAPLETTARATFNFCRSLKTLVFVNGVRSIDHYAFDMTEALETLYVGPYVETIYSEAFRASGLKAFAVDAPEVETNAFVQCPRLTELHFSERCRSVGSGAVINCAALQTVCYEGEDLSYIPRDGIVIAAAAQSPVTVRIREGLSEENVKKAQSTLFWAKDNPKLTLETGECTLEPMPLPDAAALMAPYGILPMN